MKLLKGIIAPLLIALTALSVLTFTLLTGDEAHADNPAEAQKIGAALTVIGGSDVELATTGSQLPEIAANGSFVAVVFEQNDKVYLRAALTGWGSTKLLDSTNNGGVPKLAFKGSVTNTVHVVWTGYVSGSPQKAIRHVSCTLAEPGIACGTIHTVASTALTTVTLQTPDIVVDKNDHLHVVWFENPSTGTHFVKSSRSSDEGATWSTPVNVNPSSPLEGGDDAGQPSLAVTNNNIHVVFRDKTAGGIWELNYRRSALGSHSWAAAGTSAIQDTAIAGGLHDKFSNPTIAANSSNALFITWDAQRTVTPTLYALIGVNSTNGDAGSVSLSTMAEITSTSDATTNQPKDRWSQDSAVPPVEDTLRPSIGVNSGNFELVWQERQAQFCSGGAGIGAGGAIGASDSNNGTSEIFYAANLGNGWTTPSDGVLADDTSTYSIDPDIAFDSSGRHIVFMKATGIPSGAQCADGGGSGGYGINYRGPFTTFVSSGGIYLPIVLKNTTS